MRILQALDEPVAPPTEPMLESFLQPVEGEPGKFRLTGSIPEALSSALSEQAARGEGDGVEVPRNFDLDATRARFDRLAERLSEAFGGPCEPGLAQDSACFGRIRIPAEATRTRTKRTRIPLPLSVDVSKFGGLATYGPRPTPAGQVLRIHPEDQRRIEPALIGLGYVVVPKQILDSPYDGPNA
ncbi:MAG TPA: hypothetical protein VF062_09320 [Candidatus Limnocylindrales bacterium]